MRRTFTFLGTGTSTGIPLIGCRCATCTSNNPKNQRWRCSVVVQLPGGTVLIDTAPELRLQLLRARIDLVHAVLLTHYHADHLYGLDDVRVFPLRLGGPLPVYCNQETEAHVRRVFAYAFVEEGQRDPASPPARPASFIPRLAFERIDPLRPFSVLGQEVLPLPLQHAEYHVLGFRFDKVAYCTDVSHIPSESLERLRDLDVLVLDALRHRPHPAHLSIRQALEIVAELRPRQTWLTHLSHEVEHETVDAELPAGVRLAYDGLTFEF